MVSCWNSTLRGLQRTREKEGASSKRVDALLSWQVQAERANTGQTKRKNTYITIDTNQPDRTPSTAKSEPIKAHSQWCLRFPGPNGQRGVVDGAEADVDLIPCTRVVAQEGASALNRKKWQ